MVDQEKEISGTGMEIAVIGMSGRFPGAKNIREFWQNLINGKETISFYTDEEMKKDGVNPVLIDNPRYVKAYGWIEDIEFFDAAFFGYTPLEAEIMDPQTRFFHECALEALENAGYNPFAYEKLIGVYTGAAPSFNWQALAELSGKNNILGWFASRNFNDKDFLATHTAHRLNLRGPAVTLDTACSTSLTAVHFASQGLLSGDCDMALAGASTVESLTRKGYLYQEAMINSPDGHTRAFDARAMGSNFGNGVGVVVLKRLEDAEADRDFIYAIIKSTALNNDGAGKAGYTAPSAQGQAAVIRTALNMAEVSPETIGYVETHGTGTPLGDPVEIEGLKNAFNTSRKQYCRIGSVKTNVGHLQNSAGITAFIKTVLVLKHQLIPPSLFFETPNPKIDFENSPFIVNTQLTEWKPGRYPRRAGVSSFGIGGTNAHVILEEFSEGTGGLAPLPDAHPSREYQLILLSAKTAPALEQMTQNLANHFQKHPDIQLADAAYTLQVGRQVFPYGRMLVCPNNDIREAVNLLSTESRKLKTYKSEEDFRPIIFMFPGLGSQYVNMGRELYEKEPVFRKEMDRCFEILNGPLDYDIKEILYPATRNSQPATISEKINQPEIAQPALFIFEYALAKLLIHWGIKPHAMIGYSFGEYTAACTAGVLSPGDALKLVTARAKLLRDVPRGVMLSVPLTREELAPILAAKHDLSIAIDNGPSCIVAGSPEAVHAFEKQIKERKLMCMPVPSSHALHSHMMEPVLKEFTGIAGTFTLNKPKIPYISNVTGDWLKDHEAVNPGYWASHLRKTVRFADGIKELLKGPSSVFVEIGPGRDLTTLALRLFEKHKNSNNQAINLVRHPQQDISDVYFLLNRIGRLWLYGQPIDWTAFHHDEKSRRIPLPTYPFEGQKYWIDNTDLKISLQKTQSRRKPDVADWFYIPSWKRSKPFSNKMWEISSRFNWLIFMDKCVLGKQLLEQLKKKDQDVIVVNIGTGFEKNNDRIYTINPREDNNYDLLFQELRAAGGIPDKIIHLWSFTRGNNEELEINSIENALDLGFYSLLHLAKAIGKQNLNNDIQIDVVSDRMQGVTGKDKVCPGKAAIMGPVRVIPAEYPNLNCRSIDVGSPEEETLVNQLLKEFMAGTSEQIIAYRDQHRWVQVFEPVRLEQPGKDASRLKEGGVYLITGGLGGIGFAVAQYLAKQVKAKLVLTGRTPVPPREEWEQRLKTNNNDEKVSHIRKIMDLEKCGSEVLAFSAEVENPEQMQAVITRTKKYFGRINGVIHSAGAADGTLIQLRTRETSGKVLSAKIKGTLVLDRVLKGTPLDFFVFCSSITSLLAQIGQVGYCAANSFLDAYANRKFFEEGTFTVSVNWARWQNVGIATIAEKQHKQLTGEELTGGITPGEGVDALGRILAEPLPQVIVSPQELTLLIQQLNRLNASSLMKTLAEVSDSTRLHQRPALVTEYAAPRNETEQTIANIWQNIFGFEPIGIHDDFFEIGGDSLRAMVALSKIHKEIEVEIPITDIFSMPTIEKLSEYIKKIGKSTYYSIEPVEEKEYYALSSAQKRLFILQQVAPYSTAYNESLPEVFDRNLVDAKPEEIFRKLLRRHESLRTSFELVKGEPVQRIHDDVEFKIEYYNLCNKDCEDESPGSALSVETITGNFVRPFDLSKAPLFRTALIKVDENKNILLVDVHHIIADGISIDLIIKDLKALHDDKELFELPIRYKDYVQWQNSKKEKERIIQQEEYWLKRFEVETPVLDLPIDYTRPAEQGFEGRTRRFNINKEQTQHLQAAASEVDATLFMKLVTIFYIFLSKISGQEDVVIGIPIAGRRHSDLENIIGMFVNSLPLRNFPRADMTFKEFLKEVKEQTLRDFEHQEYPFEELIDKLNVDRDISRNPIFDVMFILHTMETRESTDQSYIYERKTSRFDLTLQGFESGKNLFFRFEYCTKLFSEDTIEKFTGYFKNIISSIIDHPHRKLWEIKIVPDVEKNRVLYEFNSTAAEYPNHKTIHELFVEQVEKTPDHIALVGEEEGWKGRRVEGKKENAFGEMQLSYRELNKKSHRLVPVLNETGVKPGSIVGIMLERSVEMIIGILGILKAGGAYLPISPEYPEERINFMLSDSSAKLLLTTRSLTQEDNKNSGTVFLDFYTLLPFYSSTLPSSHPHPSPRINAPVTSLAYIIYTSGSTGKPKGVLVEHRSVVNILTAMQKEYPLGKKDTYLFKTSYLFDVSVTELFGWYLDSGRLAVLEKGGEKDPQAILAAIERFRVTHINFVPSMFTAFVDGMKAHDISILSGLKYIFLAGEALPPQLARKFGNLGTNIPLENIYGPTEGTIYSSNYSLSGWQGKGSIPIGKPMQNVKLYILDKRNMIQPVGIPGELCIGGAGLARGYLNNPGLTAEKFERAVISKKSLVNSHWSLVNNKIPKITDDRSSKLSPNDQSPMPNVRLYRTGDLARWLLDGNIEFIGRIDNQVKVRGFRVELGEIENKLLKHDHIKEAVVSTGKMIHAPGEMKEAPDVYLCAYFISDLELTVPVLKEFLSMQLPEYMIPAYFVQMDKIPVSTSGKIDRKALPPPLTGESRPKLDVEYVAPKTGLEKIIAKTWQEVLKLEIVGVYDNFFDIGGNSLKLILVNNKLAGALNRDIPVVKMFEHPTIDTFLHYLSMDQKEGEGLEEEIRLLDLKHDLAANIMEQTLQTLSEE
jgi:iturin family lipopeptide synthetase A